MNTEFFTLIFAGDLRAFKGNPHTVETPFGKPVASGLGHAFVEIDDLAASLERDAAKLSADVLDALGHIAAVAENNSFVAAAVPASEDALIALGQQFVALKDAARAAISRATGGPSGAQGTELSPQAPDEPSPHPSCPEGAE